MPAPDTIVLIHGFWVTPRSWENWIAHYEQRGFRVLAPAYPGFEVEVEALNADPTPVAERHRSPGSSTTSRRSSGSRRAADPHRATPPAGRSPRCCSTAATAPRASRSTRRRPKASPLSALAAAVHLPGAEEPRQPAPRRPLRPSSSGTTRSPTPSPRRRPAPCTSATPSPSSGRILWDSVAGQPACPATRTSASTTTTTIARRCCSSPAPEDHIMPPKVQRSQRQALPGRQHHHRDVEFSTGMPHLLPAAPGWEEVADVRPRLGLRTPGDPWTAAHHPHRRADRTDRGRRVAAPHRPDVRPARPPLRRSGGAPRRASSPARRSPPPSSARSTSCCSPTTTTPTTSTTPVGRSSRAPAPSLTTVGRGRAGSAARPRARALGGHTTPAAPRAGPTCG